MINPWTVQRESRRGLFQVVRDGKVWKHPVIGKCVFVSHWDAQKQAEKLNNQEQTK